jgi:hypothetical protein
MASRKYALAFLLASALTGCDITSDGSTGDPPSEPTADELGDGVRLREVITAADWYQPGNMESAGCKQPGDRQVNATGQVIVAIDRYDETGDGAFGNIYIEDLYEGDEEPAPFSGVTVFAPAFTPPDLRLFEGDVVDTFGNLMEFIGPGSGPFGDCKTLPEIGGTMSFRFDRGPAAPLTVVSKNGGAARWEGVLGYQKARQYMGMLIRIEGVNINGDLDDDGKGRVTANIDMGGGISAEDAIRISNELFDMANDGPEIVDGTQFQAVTGVLTYFYGFKIAPRSIDDFEL